MAYVKFKTVGDLINILSSLDPNTRIVHYVSNCERHGYSDDNCMFTETTRFKEETGYATDAFDGTEYSYRNLRRVIHTDEKFDFEAIEL